MTRGDYRPFNPDYLLCRISFLLIDRNRRIGGKDGPKKRKKISENPMMKFRCQSLTLD